MTRFVLATAAVAVIAVAVASTASLPIKLVYNGSASAPIGLYWIDSRPLGRGDFVLVRVPKRVRSLVEQRGYLPPDVPLIKRVAGVHGDQICRRDARISINGDVVATAQTVDPAGRVLPRWRGCHILTQRTFFLLGEHPRSFDGRYFGPVDRRQIFGRARCIALGWHRCDPTRSK
mgnify:CR=1 FL=1